MGVHTGNYWAIHPACVESFARGDYRRRHARRRALATKTRPTASQPLSPSAASESTEGAPVETNGEDTAEYTTMSQVNSLQYSADHGHWLSGVGQCVGLDQPKTPLRRRAQLVYWYWRLFAGLSRIRAFLVFSQPHQPPGHPSMVA